MPNISYSELTSALEKAGLPMSGKKDMQASLPYAKGAVQGAVYGQDTQLPQYNEEYKAKLAKLAEMDRKLAPMYSDPSSSMYIERASTRDSLLGGAENVGLQDLESTGQKMLGRQKELDQQTQDALTLFRDLIGMQESEGGGMDDIAALMKIFSANSGEVDPMAASTKGIIDPESPDYNDFNEPLGGLEGGSGTLQDLDRIYLDSIFDENG